MEQREELNRKLQQDWELNIPPAITEEELLQLLERRIMQLIERNAETFFQLMYRLDIPEKQLDAVLQELDAPARIARLVYDRQLQKIESRHRFRQQNDKTRDKDLEW